MTKLNDALMECVTLPVRGKLVVDHLKLLGYQDLAIREAYDRLGLSYIKRSNGNRWAYWYLPMTDHNWIWVTWWPTERCHTWDWREVFESKDYTKTEHRECPQPLTYYEEGDMVHWTEQSPFARSYQNLWFDHTDSVASNIRKIARRK